MSKTRKILVPIILILGVIQFIPHEREAVEINAETSFETENMDVDAILRKACYDCHSNETVYPWYAAVAPISFWLDGHVDNAREHLNFSEWNSYPIEDQKHIAKDLVKIVEKKEMPMLFYWLVHWEAKITDQERQVLVDYFESI